MMPRKTRGKKITLEDIYQNKNFVPPKEKNLETIFEVPRKAKDGAEILTSVKKYRRYLHFDPTQGKIQKRKIKAKKCLKKIVTETRVTRSAPETVKSEDIMYKLDALGDSSNESDVNSTHEHQRMEGTEKNTVAEGDFKNCDTVACCSTDDKANADCENSSSLADLSSTDANLSINESDNQTADSGKYSPRNSCIIA